jgi:outer membrane protein OmpA-like peptidoglycan-associated protein
MKKIFSFMIALVAMFAMSMNAQTLESSKFIDNTYFRLSGGATALMHPGCMGYEDFGHTIQGVAGAEIGKWITPKFGVAFRGDFGFRNGSTWGYAQYMDYDETVKSKACNYITVTGLAKFNMSNIFGGYKVRPVEVVLATGPMWIHGFPSKDYYLNDFGVKFQGEVNFNIAERWQINVMPELNYNLTGLYSYGTTEHPRFDARNAWWGLQVGVTYKIGKQFTECPYRYTQADIDKLNAEINDLRSRQPEKITEVQVVEKIVTKTVNDADQFVVFFANASTELTADAQATLNEVGENSIVRVIGSASPDGNADFNANLAEQRAQVVKNYLENRGVRVEDAHGVGTDLGARVAVVVIK